MMLSLCVWTGTLCTHAVHGKTMRDWFAVYDAVNGSDEEAFHFGRKIQEDDPAVPFLFDSITQQHDTCY